MNLILEKAKGDRAIWFAVILLSVFSLLAVYSSTGSLAYRLRGGDTEYFAIKHFLIQIMGLVLMFLASNVKYTYYSRISQIAIVIAVPLLVFTLIKGTTINEAARWITLPIINLSFQSSDFAKLALIIYVARLLAKKQETIGDFKEAFFPILLPVIVITGLILPENFSTAALLFSTCLVVMFIGGVKLKQIFLVGGVGVAVMAILIVSFLVFKPDQGRVSVWETRMETFLPGGEPSFQEEQSKIAIASGGIIGKMPGNSTQRNFLPHAYSDFIYAIIIEEYGLAGGAVVIILYLILFYRGIRIARKSPGTFGALLAAGLSFGVVFQALIHMAVVVDLLPTTGQPLPMISMGGTSIWFTSLAIGIILSVSRKVEENELDSVPNVKA
ncbi:MAG TPA: cell division protein FtsW [Bacteroidales bacterium]|nr:cell division protein FtsW [Bacteroidales bacterium]